MVGYACSPVGSELADWFAQEISYIEMVQANVLQHRIRGKSLFECLADFQKNLLYNSPVQRLTMFNLAVKLQET